MKLTGLSMALGLFSLTSMAGALEISCPGKIDVTESVADTDGSWRVTEDEGRRGYFLDSVSVYSGHPRELANLVPDKTIVRNQRRKYIWNLIASTPEEYWVACSYTNSRSLLARALPNGLKKCELTEVLLPTGAKLKIDSFACN